MVEVWRPVAGYEAHYEVSDLGRVRSIKRGTRVLRHDTAGRGYPQVALSLNGRVRKAYVHHLVAAAFIGPRPDGLDICHGNGDVLDARASNLRYDTRHANMRDSLVHGTHHSTRRTHCEQGHELTADNVYELATRSADGGTKVRRRCRECRRAHCATTYRRRRGKAA